MGILKYIKNINPIVTGIFFLIWATDAYFIFGNIGKYISLIFGFLLISFSAAKVKKTQKDYIFILTTSIFYILYYIVANLQAQKTLYTQNLVFGLICFVLLNAGYILAKHQDESLKIDKTISLAYSSLALLGGYAFYIKQQQIFQFVESARDLGDDSLNPIGVAYTHALLLLFLFWLFFLNLNKIVRSVIILSIGSMVLVILSTLSRGVVLYLTLLLVLFYIKGAKLTYTELKYRIQLVLSFVLLVFLIYYLSKYNPLLESKIEALTERFFSLLNFLENKNIEQSSQGRESYYLDFSRNWTSYFLGQEGYNPYPHNQFLEMYMRWGIFAFPLIIFSILVFIKSFKMINLNILRNKPISFLILLLFLFSFMQSMSSMSLEMNRMLWFGFGYLFKKRID